MQEQKKKIEVTKMAKMQHLKLKVIEERVEKICQEAEEKIVVIKNKAAAAYYENNSSIAIIDNELELKTDKS